MLFKYYHMNLKVSTLLIAERRPLIPQTWLFVIPDIRSTSMETSWARFPMVNIILNALVTAMSERGPGESAMPEQTHQEHP